MQRSIPLLPHLETFCLRMLQVLQLKIQLETLIGFFLTRSIPSLGQASVTINIRNPVQSDIVRRCRPTILAGGTPRESIVMVQFTL